MALGEGKERSSDNNLYDFSFNLNPKSRTPIRQFINFSEKALKKEAVRKVLNDLSEKCTDTTLGLLNITPKGHLIDTRVYSSTSGARRTKRLRLDQSCSISSRKGRGFAFLI